MKRLLTFLTLLTLFFGVGWAEETVYYTLDGTTTGGNQNYDSYSTISQSDMSWEVMANTNMNPWRIGGKATTTGNGSGADRPIYNTTPMGSAISKVSISVGAASNITVNSLKLYVASDASFNNQLDVVTATFAANSTINFIPTSGTEWSTGAYYRIVFNVTVSGSSNKFVQFKNATFYKNEGGSTTETCAAPTFSPATGTYYEPQSVTLSCTTPGSTIYYTTNGSTPTTSSTQYTSAIPVSETTTIKAIATADGLDPSPVASATYTIFEPETVTPTYEQSLISGFGKFYYVDKTNPTTSAIWKSNNYGAVASGQISGTKYDTESWLYTPYIDLTNATNPEVSFSHAGNFFQTYMQTDAQVKVRVLNGTEWSEWSDLAISTWPNGTSWDFVDNTTSLSTYAGKKIQIAFRYTSSTSRAGSWEIKNFKIKNVDASAPSYYLVGSFNMNGDAWVTNDDNYKFEESNGTFTLNNVNLPANTEFKIIKIDNGTTWYGGTGDGVYSINHSNYNGLPMNGSQNYKIQSEGVTSFSFSVNNNTPSNLIVSRTAKLYIKGDFNSWNEEAMTATADGWTTTKEIAANNNFGFIDEFGQYFSKEWTIKEEHLNGYEIPMEPSSKNYVMQDGGTYTLNVNSTLTKLTVNKIEAGDNYTLVTSVADLDETSEYVLFPKGSNNDSGRVMSTTRQTNNIKGSETVTTVINNEISVPADAQVITLVKTTATVDGNNVDAWMLSVGDGYLYAASNSSNYMKVSTSAEDKCKATIAIDGNAEIVFRGGYSHNVLRYNTNDNLYSCYESGKQNPVYLYKKGASTPSDKVATPVINPGSANSSNPYIVYGGKQQVAITCATEGATVYYTINGDEPTTSSNQYSEPFDLTSTGGNVTVKAIAVKADMDDSEIATSYYRFTNPNPPTFNPASGTVHNDAFNVTISSEYEDAVIYYMLDPASAPTAAQMSESGTLYENPVNVSGEGSHTIYAMVVRNGIKSSVVNATYTITSGGQPSGDGDYVKVTTATDLTDGEYLIVYEMEGTPIENGIVFDGSRTSLDAVGNTLAEPVEINNYTIASSDAVDAAVFTITYMPIAQKYSIRSSSGYYIGKEKSGNGLDCSQATVHLNTIAFDGDGNAVITAEGGCTLRYNNNTDQKRFRYYGSGQQPVALYKKVENPVDEPTEATLAVIESAQGVKGTKYAIADDYLVAVDSRNVKVDDVDYIYVWCKDDNNVANPLAPANEDIIDLMKKDSEAQGNRPWDQSNWVVLRFKDDGTVPTDLKGKKITGIVGTYVDDINYMIDVESYTKGEAESYTPNAYCVANFNYANWGANGVQQPNAAANAPYYFFMTPKVQEVCEITYAEWNGTAFTVPASSGFAKNTLTLGWEYNVLESGPVSQQAAEAYLNGNNEPDENGNLPVYRFRAVVQNNPSKGAVSGENKVYPMNFKGESNIVTAINTVEVGNGQIKSVKYVNVAGVVSDAPFQGVNIVVTEYTDGTRTTSKMLRK